MTFGTGRPTTNGWVASRTALHTIAPMPVAQHPTAPAETAVDLGRRLGDPRSQRDFTPLGTRIRARTGASDVRARLSGAATNSLRDRLSHRTRPARAAAPAR